MEISYEEGPSGVCSRTSVTEHLGWGHRQWDWAHPQQACRGHQGEWWAWCPPCPPLQEGDATQRDPGFRGGSTWTSCSSIRQTARSCMWVGATLHMDTDWSGLRAALQRTWGIGGWEPEFWADNVPLQPRKPMHPGLQQKISRSREGILLLYFTAMRFHLKECVQLWGPQRRTQTWLKSIQRKVMKMTRALAIRAGAVQPREEKALMRPYRNLPVFKWGLQERYIFFIRKCSHKMRGNSLKLTKDRFTLDKKKKLFTMRMVRHWTTGHPEKLWMPQPWNCSRPGWIRLWATWSSERYPCSWQGGLELDDLWSLLQLKSFCDSLTHSVDGES